MKTIRNTKLFSELENKPEWETLFDESGFIKETIPVLAGGLDHIEVKRKGIYFYDIGMSSAGYIKDNSFVVRPELH